MRKTQAPTKLPRPWLGLVLLAVTFASLLLYWHAILPNQLDADMASEQILAHQLAQEPGLGIMSESWYYSTELRVLNTQLVMAPLFHVFDSWHTVRVVGSAVLLALYLAAYMFFARQQKLRGGIFGAALLLLPFSDLYRQYVLAGLYYIPHIALSFVGLGCVLLALRRRGAVRAAAVAGLCAASFAAGLGGPRQIVILQIPLTLAALALAWVDRTPGGGLRAALHGVYGALLALALTADAAGVAGYAFNTAVLAKRYHFQDQNYVAYGHFLFERIQWLIDAVLSAFGWSRGSVFSFNSLFNLLALVLLGFSFWYAWRLLRTRGRYPLGHRLLGAFFLALAVCFFFLYACTNIGHSDRYLLPLAVLVVPLVEIYLCDETRHALTVQEKHRAKTAPLWALALVAALGLRTTVTYAQAAAVPNDNLPVSDYLLQNGYTQGYASFWDGNILTELSDGRLEVWTLSANNYFELRPWLQNTSHLQAVPQGWVFFVVSKWEESGERQPLHTELAAAMPETALLFENDTHKIYGFDNDAAMRKACGFPSVATENT